MKIEDIKVGDRFIYDGPEREGFSMGLDYDVDHIDKGVIYFINDNIHIRGFTIEALNMWFHKKEQNEPEVEETFEFGEIVEVWNDNDNDGETFDRIFVCKTNWPDKEYLCVHTEYEDAFKEKDDFECCYWKHIKKKTMFEYTLKDAIQALAEKQGKSVSQIKITDIP